MSAELFLLRTMKQHWNMGFWRLLYNELIIDIIEINFIMIIIPIKSAPFD